MGQTGPVESALRAAVVEVESHVAREGWDQPMRLFAIVPTRLVRAANPELVLNDDREYASVEQDSGGADVVALLETIEWDDDVVGAIVVMERVVVDGDAATLDDPEVGPQHELRLACGVLRDGTSLVALRLREHDADDDVAVGSDLAPELGQLLLASFA